MHWLSSMSRQGTIAFCLLMAINVPSAYTADTIVLDKYLRSSSEGPSIHQAQFYGVERNSLDKIEKWNISEGYSSANGKHFIFSAFVGGLQEGMILLIGSSKNQPTANVLTSVYCGGSQSISNPSIDDRGERIAYYCLDSGLKVVSLRKNKLLCTVRDVHYDNSYISPDGRYVIILGDGNRLHLLDIAKKCNVRSLLPSGKMFHYPMPGCWSPDSRFVLLPIEYDKVHIKGEHGILTMPIYTVHAINIETRVSTSVSHVLFEKMKHVGELYAKVERIPSSMLRASKPLFDLVRLSPVIELIASYRDTGSLGAENWTTLHFDDVILPKWSPDGTKISYIQNLDLLVQELETSSLKVFGRIFTGDSSWEEIHESEYEWSSDSRSIFLVRKGALHSVNVLSAIPNTEKPVKVGTDVSEIKLIGIVRE